MISKANGHLTPTRELHSLLNKLGDASTAILAAGLEYGLKAETRSARSSAVDKLSSRISAVSIEDVPIKSDENIEAMAKGSINCPACGSRVNDSAYVDTRFPNVRWHPACWSCPDCSQPGGFATDWRSVMETRLRCTFCGVARLETVILVTAHQQYVHIMWFRLAKLMESWSV